MRLQGVHRALQQLLPDPLASCYKYGPMTALCNGGTECCKYPNWCSGQDRCTAPGPGMSPVANTG